MIDRFERFSFAISEISKYWHKLAADEMETYGLKGTHSVYLLALARYTKSGMTAVQLSEYCGRDKADVSRMIGIMEEKGIVYKESIGAYKGVFRLTEIGLTAVEHVKKRASIAVEMAGKDLSDDERTIFYKAMESIISNLKKMSKDGIPE